MKKKEMLQLVIDLPMDLDKEVYKNKNTSISLLRPSKLPPRMREGYDVKKNFQIFLNHEERRFKPNHLRAFIDLGLRSKCRPDLKKKL